MNQQKRIDKIVEAVEARLQDEVGALLGTDFTIISGERKSISKADAFNNLTGKQICAQLDVTGEVTGKGCLLIGIKDAIRLGGTLIMLPDAELDEVIGREDYSEEIEDSYGEIANIIAGSFTKDFEEMYPKSCRFVRKEQEILVPAKVDVDSDIPIENQTYYQISSSMVLDGRQMGDLVMLMPAATFNLEEQPKVDEPGNTAPTSDAAVSSDNTEKVESTPEGEMASNVTRESAEDPASGPKFNAEKHKEKLDKLLVECQLKMQGEVSALLGVDIFLGDPENRLLSKEDFFHNQAGGRQILADLEVAGGVQGKSYLSLSIKDAIHLGGVLIMLPPAELENVVNDEDFSEDAEDAYGEIANIISGVYTAVFEEQYSQKLRFIRKELHQIDPLKVDIASDEPLPDTYYYTSSLSINVEGKSLGKMHMLFPAEMLRLETPSEQLEQTEQGVSSTADETVSGGSKRAGAENEQNNSSKATAPNSIEAGQIAAVQADCRKQQQHVDKVLSACRQKVEEEIGALLDANIKLANLENILVTKEEFFFEQVSGKQVVTNMDVVGESEGKSYLSIGLRDAIRVGGSLIMLPASELESTVADEEFNEDTQDAYGEIANIIAGVYTSVFEEQYSQQLRFIKTDLQLVAPMKVEIDSEEPVPDQDYYLSRMDLVMGDIGLGQVSLLFPADLLQLSGLRPGNVVEDGNVNGDEVSSGSQRASDQHDTVSDDVQGTVGNELGALDILVVGDDGSAASKISETLGKSGYTVKTLSFKDNLYNYIPGNLKAIYLVMQDVNEQAFGVAIKISSACSVPLIAAGPDWTRPKVIKAVKYGVRDILLTPASEEDIEESVNNNLLALAA